MTGTLRLTWAQPEDLIGHELRQAAEDGRDTASVAAAWRAGGGAPPPPASGASPAPAPPAVRALALRLLDELAMLPSPLAPLEPTGLTAIRSLCPDWPTPDGTPVPGTPAAPPVPPGASGPAARTSPGGGTDPHDLPSGPDRRTTDPQDRPAPPIPCAGPDRAAAATATAHRPTRTAPDTRSCAGTPPTGATPTADAARAVPTPATGTPGHASTGATDTPGSPPTAAVPCAGPDRAAAATGTRTTGTAPPAPSAPGTLDTTVPTTATGHPGNVPVPCAGPARAGAAATAGAAPPAGPAHGRATTPGTGHPGSPSPTGSAPCAGPAPATAGAHPPDTPTTDGVHSPRGPRPTAPTDTAGPTHGAAGSADPDRAAVAADTAPRSESAPGPDVVAAVRAAVPDTGRNAARVEGLVRRQQGSGHPVAGEDGASGCPGGEGEAPEGWGCRQGGAAYTDALHAAWLGRAVGCLLGKPVEKLPLHGIRAIGRATGNWPVTTWFTARGLPADLARTHPWNRRSATVALAENIDGMPEDDDLDYPLLNLLLLQRHGRHFRTTDVARVWLDELPAGRTFTAERVAYRNLLCGVEPPYTAVFRNPFREWIGAAIRADVHGWTHPGAPGTAAERAHEDAVLSHTGSGVHGAMFLAAVIAAAAGGGHDVHGALATGLTVVPPGSRLARAIRFGIGQARAETCFDTVVDRLHTAYGHYHWVHTVPNAALLAAALTHADGDFSGSICRVVSGGWDTDSNGATAGSLTGLLAGHPDALPDRWTAPLKNRLATSVAGFDGVGFDTLARLTHREACRP
ncbi:ADP-ribosylglycohydrolase family protein [Streptomyces sp. NPDC000594]|uniref:ADP-ribosylglycohydrolase family protein n=1 Tax=Streptomyces sp. NPDC000594 TaxID=3154261 RepID=UPI00331C6C14